MEDMLEYVRALKNKWNAILCIIKCDQMLVVTTIHNKEGYCKEYTVLRNMSDEMTWRQLEILEQKFGKK